MIRLSCVRCGGRVLIVNDDLTCLSCGRSYDLTIRPVVVPAGKRRHTIQYDSDEQPFHSSGVFKLVNRAGR